MSSWLFGPGGPLQLSGPRRHVGKDGWYPRVSPKSVESTKPVVFESLRHEVQADGATWETGKLGVDARPLVVEEAAVLNPGEDVLEAKRDEGSAPA